MTQNELLHQLEVWGYVDTGTIVVDIATNEKYEVERQHNDDDFLRIRSLTDPNKFEDFNAMDLIDCMRFRVVVD